MRALAVQVQHPPHGLTSTSLWKLFWPLQVRFAENRWVLDLARRACLIFFMSCSRFVMWDIQGKCSHERLQINSRVTQGSVVVKNNCCFLFVGLNTNEHSLLSTCYCFACAGGWSTDVPLQELKSCLISPSSPGASVSSYENIFFEQ